MKEFNLSHAISLFVSLTGSVQGMWGLYVAATFTAAGFGASIGDDFTPATSLVVVSGYIAFAIGHVRVVLNNVAAREVLRGEILAAIEDQGADVTDYPRSLEAVLTIASGRTFTFILHGVVDTCVIALILGLGLS